MMRYIRLLFRPLFHIYWKVKNHIEKFSGKTPIHIIICGYPRSGTSLLYNMISTFIDGFRCEEFECKAVERLERSGNYVTKFPLDILNIDNILESNKLGKELYFIVVTRDVRDIITSKHPNIPNEYFIGYKNSWWPQDPQFNNWKYDAAGIESIYTAIQHSLDNKKINILKVSYENLVKDADNVQKQIEDFIEIKFSGNFTDFHKWKDKHAYKYTGQYQAKNNSLVRENKQIDNSRIAKWKKPEHQQIIYEQFTKYPELFNILIKEGYENDKEWFSKIKSTATTST